MIRLISLYHSLHTSVHAKNSHLKVHHCVGREAISLAWATPLFEMYCVAGPSTSRNALAQGANKVAQWARREEERIFIVGGAVSCSTLKAHDLGAEIWQAMLMIARYSNENLNFVAL